VSEWGDVSIPAHLFPITNDGVNSKIVRVDETVNFDEILQFSNVPIKDLENSTLRLSLFSSKKTKTKAAFIGEAFIHCSICCFCAKHTAIRRKSKDWFARNQDNVSEWGDVSIRELLF
jgi:hypothetical protein